MVLLQLHEGLEDARVRGHQAVKVAKDLVELCLLAMQYLQVVEDRLEELDSDQAVASE